MTTATKTVLAALAKVPRASLEELVSATGMSKKRLHETLQILRKSDRIRSIPVAYKITPVGMADAATVPATPKDVIARKVARRRKRRAEAIGSIVGQAINTQPNSVFSMGAHL